MFIAFVILLRIAELLHSRRNERWLREQGAIEYGQRHYPYIVAMHALFFVAMIAEYLTKASPTVCVMLLVYYALLLGFRFWVIASLGKYWNTKIFRIPGVPLINKGPYKYFSHPNYIVVTVEIAIAPLAFQLYYTAIVFTVLNAIMLSVRIREENKVLRR